MHLPFDPKVNIKEVFTTPLGLFAVPGADQLNRLLEEAILAREASDTTVERSNYGGWHSDDTLLNWPEIASANLGDTFRSAVSHMIAWTTRMQRFNIRLTLGAWANVNRAGTFNTSHIHPGNHFSGVYYVRAPDLADDGIRNAGNIQFYDPRGPISMVQLPGQLDTLSIPPREGTLLIFPAWLYHSVNSFTRDKVRISIAFNARIDEFQPGSGQAQTP